MKIVSTVEELITALLDMPADALVVVRDSDFGMCAITDVVLDESCNLVELV